MKKRQNYLNNKDLLKEIHKSKLSFCSSIDDIYNNYDIIIDDAADITPEIIQQAKENQAQKLSAKAYEEGVAEWYSSGSKGQKPKQAEFQVDPNTIDDDNVVIRVMTFDHVPKEPGRKKNPKTIADHHTRCNFPPFKHYALLDGQWKEVVRSHWDGGFSNGKFSKTHGKITNELAKMMMELCKRYAMRGNWRGYTYNDEMQSNALVQLSQVGLQFNESRSQNPFAYYTTTVSNSFTRVLNLEQHNQRIRDDILQDSGYMPSFKRQLDDEAAQQKARSEDEEIEKQKEELKKAGYNIV